MSNHILPESPNVLMKVIQKYKNEQQKPRSVLGTVFHYHDKSPDAALHLQFLEAAHSYITNQVNPRERNKAVLATLFIFKGLLSDPNQQGQIFGYWVDKLQLDKEIKGLVKSIKPDIEVDIMDPRYLHFCDGIFEFAEHMVESPEIKNKLPQNFLNEIQGVLVTDRDYIQRVDNTIEGTIAKL